MATGSLAAGDYLLLTQAEGFRGMRRTVRLLGDEEIEIVLADVAPLVVTPVIPPDIVQAKNGEFVLNGRPFRFVGVNIRGLVHYGDSQVCFGASREGDREEQLKGAQRIGARVVRLFLANRFRSTQEIGDRLKVALDMLAAFDMYAIVSFIDVYNDTWFQVQGDYETYYSGPDSMLNGRSSARRTRGATWRWSKRSCSASRSTSASLPGSWGTSSRRRTRAASRCPRC